MLSHIVGALAGLPPQVIVLAVAALPVIELRGGIPVAMAMGFTPGEAIALGILGNLLPIPFVLLLLRPLRRAVAARGPFRPFFEWLERRALRRRDLVDRYGPWGLALFVGVPLPGTGAWTGAILAAALDLSFGRSLLAIVAGVLLAGVIVLGLSSLGFLALR